MALKIIAVDDEVEVLKMIKSIVEPLGCEILTLADSAEAARRLDTERFDGMFVDAQMPKPDGFELTERARKSALNKQIPIVMITGQDDVETMRKGFKVGVTGFLGKPLSWEKLYSLLKAMRGPMLREKRRQARLPFYTPVKCALGPDPGQQFMSASLVISECGMLLKSATRPEVNQQIELEFQVPDSSKPLTIVGKVLRKEPPDRIAIEFIEVKHEDREAIKRYIAGSVIL